MTHRIYVGMFRFKSRLQRKLDALLAVRNATSSRRTYTSNIRSEPWLLTSSVSVKLSIQSNSRRTLNMSTANSDKFYRRIFVMRKIFKNGRNWCALQRWYIFWNVVKNEKVQYWVLMGALSNLCKLRRVDLNLIKKLYRIIFSWIYKASTKPRWK